MEWDAPQKEIYTAATKKAQALSDNKFKAFKERA